MTSFKFEKMNDKKYRDYYAKKIDEISNKSTYDTESILCDFSVKMLHENKMNYQ